MMINIYQNEFDKQQRLTVSMEIEKIKKLVESNLLEMFMDVQVDSCFIQSELFIHLTECLN